MVIDAKLRDYVQDRSGRHIQRKDSHSSAANLRSHRYVGKIRNMASLKFCIDLAQISQSDADHGPLGGQQMPQRGQ